MTKIVRTAKLRLANLIKLKLASVETDKVTLYYEDELKEGVEVYAMDSEGVYILPEDGEYVASNQVIIVEGGIVQEIRDKNTDPVDLEANPEDLPDPAPTSEDAVSPERFNELLQVVKELTDDVNDLQTEYNEFKSQFAAVKVENEQFKAKFAAMGENLGDPVPPTTNPINPDKSKSLADKFFGVLNN